MTPTLQRASAAPGRHRLCPWVAVLLLPMGSAAAECPASPPSPHGVASAVHVVFGPLSPDGDPGHTHRLEHLAMNGPQVACLERNGAEVSAWTGPDTLHLVWRGTADATRIDAVVAGLEQAVVAPPDDPETAATAEAELEVERALTPASASARLRRDVSRPGTRYARALHGPAGGALADTVAEVQAAPMRVVVAQDGHPVRWWSPRATTAAPPTITPVAQPPWAHEAWRVEGTLDCVQRRAVWAVVHGRAEVSGGTAIGWLGHQGGVVGVSDAARRRIPSRRVRAAARRWDMQAVATTERRARDLVDQTWMGVGHLGLGVCPSVHPLSTPTLRAAQGWLSGTEVPPASPLPPPEGSLVLPALPWGAVWRAGLPPEGWDADPDLFYTRTPGGYTIDGPLDRLSGALSDAPAAALVPPEDPIEQALVLSGADAVSVAPLAVGVVPPVPPGPLRVPAHDTVFVVDVAHPPDRVELDVVFAIDGAADLLAPGGSLRAPLDADGRVRDTRVRPEGPRVRLSATLPIDQVSTVVAALTRPVLPLQPGHPDLHRAAARPWEAARTGPRRADATAVGPHVLVLRGPAAPVLAALEGIGVHPDRVLTPAQLGAEAAAIR